MAAKEITDTSIDLCVQIDFTYPCEIDGDKHTSFSHSIVG